MKIICTLGFKIKGFVLKFVRLNLDQWNWFYQGFRDKKSGLPVIFVFNVKALSDMGFDEVGP